MLPLVKLLVSQAVMGPSAAMFAAWALSSIATHSPRVVRAFHQHCCCGWVLQHLRRHQIGASMDYQNPGRSFDCTLY